MYSNYSGGFGRHPVVPVGRSAVEIGGFSFPPFADVYTQIVWGSRWASWGIPDGSVLLCCREADIRDGDLVLLSGCQEVCRYRADPADEPDAAERVCHSTGEVCAKVLAAFCFFDGAFDYE